MEFYGVYSEKDNVDRIKKYLENGAIVLDVRTEEEWNEGHGKNARHVVLNLIPESLEKLKTLNKPYIAVCRSGGRSGQATQFLVNNGLDVINGGPWQNVDQFISED